MYHPHTSCISATISNRTVVQKLRISGRISIIKLLIHSLQMLKKMLSKRQMQCFAKLLIYWTKLNYLHYSKTGSASLKKGVSDKFTADT
jgi:hypothetical protein